MTLSDYIKGSSVILLSWTVGPILNIIPEEVISENLTPDLYFGYLRNIASTLTTFIILVTAIFKLIKERKQK